MSGEEQEQQPRLSEEPTQESVETTQESVETPPVFAKPAPPVKKSIQSTIKAFDKLEAKGKPVVNGKAQKGDGKASKGGGKAQKGDGKASSSKRRREEDDEEPVRVKAAKTRKTKKRGRSRAREDEEEEEEDVDVGSSSGEDVDPTFDDEDDALIGEDSASSGEEVNDDAHIEELVADSKKPSNERIRRKVALDADVAREVREILGRIDSKYEFKALDVDGMMDGLDAAQDGEDQTQNGASAPQEGTESVQSGDEKAQPGDEKAQTSVKKHVTCADNALEPLILRLNNMELQQFLDEIDDLAKAHAGSAPDHAELLESLKERVMESGKYRPFWYLSEDGLQGVGLHWLMMAVVAQVDADTAQESGDSTQDGAETTQSVAEAAPPKRSRARKVPSWLVRVLQGLDESANEAVLDSMRE